MVLSPNVERRLGFAQLAGRRQCPAMTWEPLRRCAVSWPRGVTVSTLDSESSDRGSNPREAFFSPAAVHLNLANWVRNTA